MSAITFVVEGVAHNVGGINWEVTPEAFPIDGQWMFMFTMLIAVGGYIFCSLVSWLALRKPAHDLDHLLHRGRWAIKDEHGGDVDTPVSGLRAILPTSEFTFGDRVIYYAKLAWTVVWFAIFLFGTLYAYHAKPALESWITFWWWKVMITVVIGVATTIWFFIGGIIDIKKLYQRLRTMERDHADVGLVKSRPAPGGD